MNGLILFLISGMENVDCISKLVMDLSRYLQINKKNLICLKCPVKTIPEELNVLVVLHDLKL
jgi:hypothetical protein